MYTFKPLARGNYNKVFKGTHSGGAHPIVLKVEINPGTMAEDLLDEPERAVRLWNEINPDLAPKAYTIPLKGLTLPEVGLTKRAQDCRVGWVAPFVSGMTSAPGEVQHALVDIFNQTGRVIVDAIVAGNFVTTNNGQVVCIDIGMSLKLQETERSQVSFAAWTENNYKTWLASYISSPKYGAVTTMVSALLALQLYFPQIKDASFILEPKHESLKHCLSRLLMKSNSYCFDKQSFENARQALAHVNAVSTAVPLSTSESSITREKVNPPAGAIVRGEIDSAVEERESSITREKVNPPAGAIVRDEIDSAVEELDRSNLEGTLIERLRKIEKLELKLEEIRTNLAVLKRSEGALIQQVDYYGAQLSRLQEKFEVEKTNLERERIFHSKLTEYLNGKRSTTEQSAQKQQDKKAVVSELLHHLDSGLRSSKDADSFVQCMLGHFRYDEVSRPFESKAKHFADYYLKNVCHVSAARKSEIDLMTKVVKYLTVLHERRTGVINRLFYDQKKLHDKIAVLVAANEILKHSCDDPCKADVVYDRTRAMNRLEKERRGHCLYNKAWGKSKTSDLVDRIVACGKKKL